MSEDNNNSYRPHDEPPGPSEQDIRRSESNQINIEILNNQINLPQRANFSQLNEINQRQAVQISNQHNIQVRRDQHINNQRINNHVLVNIESEQQAQQIINNKNKKQDLIVPQLSVCLARVVFFLNLFIPGLGTIIMGCYSGANCAYWICVGLLQAMLAIMLVGWIWAIVTGCQAMSNSV